MARKSIRPIKVRSTPLVSSNIQNSWNDIRYLIELVGDVLRIEINGPLRGSTTDKLREAQLTELSVFVKSLQQQDLKIKAATHQKQLADGLHSIYREFLYGKSKNDLKLQREKIWSLLVLLQLTPAHPKEINKLIVTRAQIKGAYGAKETALKNAAEYLDQVRGPRSLYLKHSRSSITEREYILAFKPDNRNWLKTLLVQVLISVFDIPEAKAKECKKLIQGPKSFWDTARNFKATPP